MHNETIRQPLPFPALDRPRADPMVVPFDGDYLLFGTAEDEEQKHLHIRRAHTLAGLHDAEDVTLLGDDLLAWAPELHRIGGRWWLNWARGASWKEVRCTAMPLREGGDPTSRDGWDWEAMREVTRADGSPLEPDGISLDMTWFVAKGQWYAMWSNRVIRPEVLPATLHIATVDPADPTRLTSAPVEISAPEYDWEQAGAMVDEGPFALHHDGKVVVVFAAAAVSVHYATGALIADEGSDLLDPSSWRKHPKPLLDSSSVPGQFGPGHCAFFTDYDGTEYVTLHAQRAGEIKRNTIIRPMHWGDDGLPVLA